MFGKPRRIAHQPIGQRLPGSTKLESSSTQGLGVLTTSLGDHETHHCNWNYQPFQKQKLAFSNSPLNLLQVDCELPATFNISEFDVWEAIGQVLLGAGDQNFHSLNFIQMIMVMLKRRTKNENDVEVSTPAPAASVLPSFEASLASKSELAVWIVSHCQVIIIINIK